MSEGFPALVLFDLDGTLLDSAPDFVATVNALRAATASRRWPRQPCARMYRRARARCWRRRSRNSTRQRAMHWCRSSSTSTSANSPATARRSTASKPCWTRSKRPAAAGASSPTSPNTWRGNCCRCSAGKQRCAVLVGGDTLPVRKPDPLPLLHAAQACGVAAADCAYVGDDERDIVAARAAGMPFGGGAVGLSPRRGRSDRPGRATAWSNRRRDLLDPAAWPRAAMSGMPAGRATPIRRRSPASSTSGAHAGRNGASPKCSCRASQRETALSPGSHCGRS